MLPTLYSLSVCPTDISKEVQEFFSQIVNFIKLNAVSYFWSKYDKNAKDYLQYSIELDLVFAKGMGIANFISCLTKNGSCVTNAILPLSMSNWYCRRFTPFNNIVPCCTSQSRNNKFIRVLFPAPLSPTIPLNFPDSISKFSPWYTDFLPS